MAGKWRGTVSQVIPAPIDKIWAIIADFDGLHRHFPQIFESCETVDGEKNKVGSLRALVAPLPNGTKLEAKERLIACDDANHTTSYTMEDSSAGWTGYVGHVNVKTVENDQTHVDWSFEVNPIANLTEETYISRQNGLFEAILKTMKETLSK